MFRGLKGPSEQCIGVLFRLNEYNDDRFQCFQGGLHSFMNVCGEVRCLAFVVEVKVFRV